MAVCIGAAGAETGATGAGFGAAFGAALRAGAGFFFTTLGGAFLTFFLVGAADRVALALAFFFFFFGAAFFALEALFFFDFDLSFFFFFLAMDSEPRTDETNSVRNRAVPQSSLETTEPPSDTFSIIAKHDCSKTQM